jgi:hypothetical protein
MTGTIVIQIVMWLYHIVVLMNMVRATNFYQLTVDGAESRGYKRASIDSAAKVYTTTVGGFFSPHTYEKDVKEMHYGKAADSYIDEKCDNLN